MENKEFNLSDKRKKELDKKILRMAKCLPIFDENKINKLAGEELSK